MIRLICIVMVIPYLISTVYTIKKAIKRRKLIGNLSQGKVKHDLKQLNLLLNRYYSD